MINRKPWAILILLVLTAAALTCYLGTRGQPNVNRPSVQANGSYRGGSLPDRNAQAAMEAAARAVPVALSYDYRTLDKGLSAATKLMTASFADQFSDTFDKTARPMAADKHAVTRALVRAAGLVRLEGDDRAICLVYVDQVLVSSKGKRKSEPLRIQQNRVTVQLRRVDDTWKVDGIEPF